MSMPPKLDYIYGNVSLNKHELHFFFSCGDLIFEECIFILNAGKHLIINVVESFYVVINETENFYSPLNSNTICIFMIVRWFKLLLLTV